MMTPKYPAVTVSLVGQDGNAVSILSRVRVALKRARVPDAEVEAFTAEATSGDYQHLLTTVRSWVRVR